MILKGITQDIQVIIDKNKRVLESESIFEVMGYKISSYGMLVQFVISKNLIIYKHIYKIKDNEIIYQNSFIASF